MEEPAALSEHSRTGFLKFQTNVETPTNSMLSRFVNTKVVIIFSKFSYDRVNVRTRLPLDFNKTFERLAIYNPAKQTELALDIASIGQMF